jgi:transposase
MERGEISMGRKALAVSTLHGYTIEELVNLKNGDSSDYAKIILSAIIMRYYGYSPKEIMNFTGKTNATIVKYITAWNKLGLKCLEDHRGGSEGEFTAEMLDDLIYTLNHKTPNKCGFIAHSWSCNLLSKYIANNYGIKYSTSWIHAILVKNNQSYKRAQPKQAKANKQEQEEFEKNASNTRFFRSFF